MFSLFDTAFTTYLTIIQREVKTTIPSQLLPRGQQNAPGVKGDKNNEYIFICERSGNLVYLIYIKRKKAYIRLNRVVNISAKNIHTTVISQK